MLPSALRKIHPAIYLTAYYACGALMLYGVGQAAPSLRPAAEIGLGLAGLALIIWGLGQGESTSAADGRRLVWLVAGISLGFHLLRWWAEGGALSARTGDDDEIYLLLGMQLGGVVPGPAQFSFRPPGLPALIGLLLRLSGGEGLWLLALIQRLLLSAVPVLLFVLLHQRLPAGWAALAGLLFLFTEVNEAYPSRALIEPAYTFGLVMALLAAWHLLHRSQSSVGWAIIGGLSLAWLASLRSSGLMAALLLSAVVFVFGEHQRLHALLMLLPPLLMAGGLAFYNYHQTGRASLSELGALNVALHLGRQAAPLADSAARRCFLELLPEASAADLFKAGEDFYQARYRAALSGQPGRFQACAGDAAGQLLRENPGIYAGWAARRLYAGLVLPREELFPQAWLAAQNAALARVYGPPSLECRAQVAAAPHLLASICDAYAEARARAHFAPGLPPAPAPVHALTVSLAYRLRLLLWPLTWGISGLAALGVLIARPGTRPFGLALAAVLLAELLPTVLFVPIDSRYNLIYAPVYWLAGWLALASLRPSAPEEAL